MKIGDRKLSETTPGSLVMSLPKWLSQSWGLKRGDYVSLELDGERALRLTPKRDGEEAKSA